MQSKLMVVIAALLATTLVGCAGSMPKPVHRAELPDAPEECLAETKLPPAKVGRDLEVFAADNRAAAIDEGKTKRRCGQFIRDVMRGYGAPSDEQ
jgi:hypothetical protein